MKKFACLVLFITLSLTVYCETTVEPTTPETTLPKIESNVSETPKSPKNEVPAESETPKAETPATESAVPVLPVEQVTPATETAKPEAPVTEEVPVAKETPKEVEKSEKPTETVTPVPVQPTVATPITQVGSSLGKATSNFVYYCGVFVFLVVGLVGGIVGLSAFYKYRMNTMKQAPFTPPSFLSSKLFPRDHSYYFEYETELGSKDEELNDRQIERYLN